MNNFLNNAVEKANKIFDREEMKKFLAQFAIEAHKLYHMEECETYLNQQKEHTSKKIDPICLTCGYHNKKATDYYKCHVAGSCPRYI